MLLCRNKWAEYQTMEIFVLIIIAACLISECNVLFASVDGISKLIQWNTSVLSVAYKKDCLCAA